MLSVRLKKNLIQILKKTQNTKNKQKKPKQLRDSIDTREPTISTDKSYSII